MKERLFRFKRFKVSHARSSMPIGVDGVLIGAWATSKGGRVLDVGTGCGVIALMVAQRDADAFVEAIDVDTPSIEEASMNFDMSPWSGRIKSKCVSFCDLDESGAYNLIVSNPPFFDSGVRELDTARKKARHSGELSPETLIQRSAALLTNDGLLSMIVPSGYFMPLCEMAEDYGLSLSRACYVKDHEGAPEKRVMLEFARKDRDYNGREMESGPVIERLTMFESGQEPTHEYRNLCGQFYLKF